MATATQKRERLFPQNQRLVENQQSILCSFPPQLSQTFHVCRKVAVSKPFPSPDLPAFYVQLSRSFKQASPGLQPFSKMPMPKCTDHFSGDQWCLNMKLILKNKQTNFSKALFGLRPCQNPNMAGSQPFLYLFLPTRLLKVIMNM